jgi:hypothetical protein
MAFSASQAKAILLICLLVGHEAARVHESAINLNPSLSDAETTWKKSNFHCKWQALKMHPGCDGAGCMYRPLPLDRSLSSSCRISIEYMVAQDNVTEYVGNACGFVVHKSSQFKEMCSQNKGVSHWKSHASCLRKAGHLLQASEFINAVQANIGEGSTGFSQMVTTSLDVAGANIASVLGEDGGLILKLLGEVRGNVGTIYANDPKEIMTSVVGVMYKLTNNDERIQELARGEAKELMSKIANAKGDTTSEDVVGMGSSVSKVDANRKAFYSSIEEATMPVESDASALMETSSQLQGSNVGKILVIVLIFLFVPFGFIWVILDLLLHGPLWKWSKDD